MKTNRKQSSLLDFHRPSLRSDIRDAPIPPLSQESKNCIRNLANYKPPPVRVVVPKSRTAAVLVALFVGRKGDLYVLLSRRASTLRSYAGDTSLPGGKWEAQDSDAEATARREAFEEIGLPVDSRKVPLLCILEPFLARNQLVVTPVVVLVLDNTLRPILNRSEVASLFSHPLASFLDSEPPFPELLEADYHTSQDWTDEEQKTTWRAHRFLTGREAGGTRPIFGLTAAILIRVATVGYAREPDFAVFAPGQPSQEERIVKQLKTHPVFREAARREGIDPDRPFGPSSRSRL